MTKLRLIFLLLLQIPFLLWGQSRQIKGKVLDADNDLPLVGANIYLKSDLTSGSVSDLDGNFVLTVRENEPDRLICEYLGYDTLSILIDSDSDFSQDLILSLKPSTFSLDLVEVTGEMEGTIRAFVQQKQAENIKNIVSAQQIASFPDMNAAEVMQRIPGVTLQRDQGDGRYVQLRGTPPELTNFNVNGEQIPSPEGNVRYVGMDIIPSDQIEFVEVTKVLTPDMDADGIGGSVNIKTKEALSEKPDIRATVAGGYTNLRGEPNYQVQFSYGQQTGKLGFQINSSFFQNNQGADNLEYKYAKGPFFGSQDDGKDNYFVQYREVQLRHYNITRTRIGISPSFRYNLGQNSHLYLMGMYNSFSDAETRRRLIYDCDDALSETYYLFGGIEHDVKDRIKKQELGTLSLGGEHSIGKVKLDYQIFYAYAQESEPDRLEAVFDSPGQAIAIDFDRSDPDYPVAVFPNPTNAVNVTRYDEYELNELLLENSRITDENITPRFNIQIPYSFGTGNNGYLKFGSKLRMKKKRRDIRSQEYGAYFEESKIYPGVGPPLSLVDVSDGFIENDLINHGYLLEYMPSADLIRDFFEFYPQHFIFDKDATRINSFGEDYQANEKIFAGYGMFRHDFERLMLLGGLRYERTKIDYSGTRVVTDRGRFVDTEDLNDQRTHTFWLPQVQLKYQLNDFVNIRSALTYSYSRPNFEDVLPYREEDRDEVKFGNPDLRYPQSTNVDFLIERYFQKSIFSGGLFYKKIDDFIFFYKRFAHEGDPKDYGLVEITKAINGASASVYGAEFQAQFKFSGLPGFLKNFGVYTNYTYTYSDAEIRKRFPANYSDAVVVFGQDDLDVFTSNSETEKIPLPGQAEHTANFALFYDSRKLFTRLTLNYQDDFLYRLGADPDLDEYYDASLRLDLTMNYFVTEQLKFFADFINLTNTPLKYYLGQTDRIQKLEYYSWWCRAGVKLIFD